MCHQPWRNISRCAECCGRICPRPRSPVCYVFLGVNTLLIHLLVRPDLTWRDIQHLCVKTARVINSEDPDWETMASGRLYSYKYGFGVLDAYAYVTAAKDWELVKPQTWFTIDPIQINNGSMNILNEFSGGEFIVPGGIKSTATVTPAMLKKNNFDSLEHVNVKVWISHGKRGDVEVQLVSPNGIKSVLAAPRKSDADTFGYPGWTFMSVKHW
jgi:kexin